MIACFICYILSYIDSFKQKYILMSWLIGKIKENIPSDTFTDAELKNLLAVSPDSRYSLVKRAISKNEIIRVRRGLYILSGKNRRMGLNLYELALRIYRPAYISLESALSYHGWIPEGVPTITSVCMRRSKEIHTPLAVFSYARAPAYSYIGVERIDEGKSIFLMAEPTKAIMDYVYANKMNWTGIEPFLNSLRIEPENLNSMSLSLLKKMASTDSSHRIKKFARGLIGELEK